MTQINEEAVGKCIGENFSLKSYSNGNIQASIKDLKSTGPYDVCKQLIAAADALVAAGVVENPNTCVRLSWNTQKKDENGQDIWKPFPQLWVNQPTQTQVALQESGSRVDKLESNVEQIMGMFQKLLETQGGATKPAAPAVAPPPATENPF